ncbi:MAG: hypothetical protein ACK2UW_23420, partial [Anaerolineales bacterium]
MQKNSLIPLTVILLASLLLAACQAGGLPGNAAGTPTPQPPTPAEVCLGVDGQHVTREAVTRAVGVYESVEADTLDFDVLPGDRFLLCSDGLSEYAEESDLLK